MNFKPWQLTVGTLFLVACSAATALSLGRVRGTALVGRSLDLSVQANLEAQEATPEATCFAAELFYGESRVSPNSVSVTPVRSAGGELQLRVRSSAVVDEPVVTLFLRSTCGASVSRRYVLLAEALTEAVEPSSGFSQPGVITPPRSATAPSVAQPAGSIVSGEPRQAFGGVASSDAQGSSAAQRREQRRSQRQAQLEAQRQRASEASLAPARVPKTVAKASVVRKPEPASQGAPRLQLDLLDASSILPSLRGSNELITAPTGDEAVRRQAQALWRSLNASPEETLLELQRADKLQSQNTAALEQTKRQGQEIASLSAQLQTAKKERYVNPLTIGLGLLTLAALALCWWFWRRSTGMPTKPWWGGSSAKQAPKDEQDLWKHLADSAMAELPSKDGKGIAKTELAPSLKTSAGHSEFGTSDFSKSTSGIAGASLDAGQAKSPSRFPVKLDQSGGFKAASLNPNQSLAFERSAAPAANAARSLPPSSARNVAEGKRGFGQSDFAPAAFNAPRVVAAEELFDIQEQADFFLSLNQPEQAIEVLKNHITENVETSALAYMDLFDVYHNTKQETEYSQLRDEFNRVFNADVPEFSKYGARSNGLEDFPSVLGSIQEQWQRPQQVQDVIEESIFRQPDQNSQPLDMLAYRELMLLYALAKELSKPGAYSSVPISTQVPLQGASGLGSLGPDVDLGDGLMLSSPDLDMLSAKDQTMSLDQPLLPKKDKSGSDGGLDFDLSDSAELQSYKLPGSKK